MNDQEVAKILNDPNMRRAFPFLATAHARITSQAKQSTGCCGKKKTANTADYEGIRRSIAELPLDQKAKFKQLSGGKQVVVTYLLRPGKKVTVKF